jgi:hypothetical protein
MKYTPSDYAGDMSDYSFAGVGGCIACVIRLPRARKSIGQKINYQTALQLDTLRG